MLRRPFESTQYTSLAFGQRCRAAGVRPSMGSVGDCFDNAMCESFFATLVAPDLTLVEGRQVLMLDGVPQYSATWHSYFNRITDGSYQ